MSWLVLTIVCGIAAIGGAVWSRGVPQETPRRARLSGLMLSGGAILAWAILSIFMSLHTVGQREVGIVYNFSGTISGKKSPGVVLTAPWQTIKKENVAIQKEVFEFVGNDAAVSRDQQPISATLVVNYQVEPAYVVDLYKRVGPTWRTVLLDGRVPQDFKETTAQFTSPQITLNRPALRKITLQRLRRELSQYDIRVVDVFVNNVGYSQAYTNAIEAKQVQVQAALQAQAKVAQAKAEAQQAIEKARGEAKAISLRGKALRNNPEILRLEAIDKLNPNAQVVICTGQTCPAFLPGALNGR